MEIVNNNAMDIETKTATKLEIDTTSNLLITPKKNVNLDVENLLVMVQMFWLQIIRKKLLMI